MRRRTLFLLALLALSACKGKITDQGVLVQVTNSSNVGGIVQLRATVSNRDASDTLLLPATRQATPMKFPTSFSLNLPSSRTGQVDIAIEGLNMAGGVVASGTGSAGLQADTFVPAPIDLRPGIPPCGAGGSCVDAAVGAEVGDAADSGGRDGVGSGGATSVGGAMGSAGANGMSGGTAAGAAPGNGGAAGGGATGLGGGTGLGGMAGSGGTASGDASAGGAGGGTASSGGAGGRDSATTTEQTGGTGGTNTSWTIPVGCGDKVVTPPEQCDDGNLMPFDGCSSDCRVEPTCTGIGPCTSQCGDGIVQGEDCDDGNTRDGDGCSSSCKVESGFTCAEPPVPNPILVPVVYRDFRFHNPTDFEASVIGSSMASTGVVRAELDSEGKPIFTGLTGTSIHIESTSTFATWYRNIPDVNHPTPSKMALWDNGNGAYVNRYGPNGEQWRPVTEVALLYANAGGEAHHAADTIYTDHNVLAATGKAMLECILRGTTCQEFFVARYADGNPLYFPVDADTFTPSSERLGATIPPLYDESASWPWDLDDSGSKRLHNFSFTSEIRYWFKYDADQSHALTITGDDDIWVFINKKLAVDLGGIHSPVEGSIILDASAATKFGLVAGSVYEVAVFQAERQSTTSTFWITLSGFNTNPSVCQPN